MNSPPSALRLVLVSDTHGMHDAVDGRVRPRVHVFGHIHEAWGRHDGGGTTFVNARICSLGYEPSQAPIVVDLTLAPRRR